MNILDSLYNCHVPGCTDFPMLVVTADIHDNKDAFLSMYVDQLGAKSTIVPMETGGLAFAQMFNETYSSGPSFWIEPDRNWTYIIAGGGYHERMTDSLIEKTGILPHIHTKGGTQFLLTTTRDSTGMIGRSPNTTKYDSATVVTLNPMPASGYEFDSWGGDLSGTTVPQTVTMDRARSVTASFRKLPDTYGVVMPSGTGNEFKVSNDTMFYDDGRFGHYSMNFSGELTLRPSVPGNLVELDFQTFATEEKYDNFTVYDGSSTSAKVIGTYSGKNCPGTVRSSGGDGSLTIAFSSDNMNSSPGWSAKLRQVNSTGVEPQTVRLHSGPTIVTSGTELRIENVTGTTAVQLFSISGRMILSREINGNSAISTANLSTGTYLVRMATPVGISTVRWIKQ